jgi:hypothetical protein
MAALRELGRLAADLGNPETVPDALPQPLSVGQLQQALSHEGSLERLRCFMQKLRSGQNVTLAAVGGSITAGSSTAVSKDLSGTFHMKVHQWLQRRYPQAHIRHATAAIPSVYHEDYMEHCLTGHVAQSADLVLLDTPANLCARCKNEVEPVAKTYDHKPFSKKTRDDEDRCRACDDGMSAIELMLRTLLELPRRPAVVFVNAFMWWDMRGHNGWKRTGKNSLFGLEGLEFHRQWGHGRHEHKLDELAKYYAAPSVSLRDVIFHDGKATSQFNGMPLDELYKDRIHPSGGGHSIMAQALIYLFKRTALLQAVDPTSRCGCGTPSLPPPMLGDRTRQRLQCLNAHALRKLPGDCPWGLSIADSRRRGKGTGMHYLSTDRPGARCQVGVSVQPEEPAARYIGIAYLSSMKGEMGVAHVECPIETSCSCNRLSLQGHAWKASLGHVRLASLFVNVTRGSTRCDLRFTVTNSENATGACFSIAALLVNPYSTRWWFGEWLLRRALSSLAQGHSADEAELGRENVVGWEEQLLA